MTSLIAMTETMARVLHPLALSLSRAGRTHDRRLSSLPPQRRTTLENANAQSPLLAPFSLVAQQEFYGADSISICVHVYI